MSEGRKQPLGERPGMKAPPPPAPPHPRDPDDGGSKLGEELRIARETIRRLNRRCQEAERVLGDITKHPAVNQSRTGRMSFAVMALAVKQANEKAEELERHYRGANLAWTDEDLRRAADSIERGDFAGRWLFIVLRSIRDLKVPPFLGAEGKEAEE